MDIKYESDAEVTITVEGYTPARPAPICSDHDSPFFSDDGYAAEYERCEATFRIGNREIELTEDQAIAIYEELAVEIDEKATDLIYNSL